MSSGSLAGFPVVDVTTTLYDGSYHDVDSSVMAFQIAARAAFREGMKKAGVQLLEPIMKVGVGRMGGGGRCAWAGSRAGAGAGCAWPAWRRRHSAHHSTRGAAPEVHRQSVRSCHMN